MGGRAAKCKEDATAQRAAREAAPQPAGRTRAVRCSPPHDRPARYSARSVDEPPSAVKLSKPATGGHTFGASPGAAALGAAAVADARRSFSPGACLTKAAEGLGGRSLSRRRGGQTALVMTGSR